MSEDQYFGDSRSSWERLCQVAVKGAEYDSPERQPHPKCLEGTRVDLLDHIHGLLDNGEKSRIVWLRGTAGVGKSAVAFTVAERMKALKVSEKATTEKRLAGSFFFSRKHTRRCTTGYFFATLAWQLASNFSSVREDVNRAIREIPALLGPDKSLHDQMEALFLQPLLKLRLRLRDRPPLVFVIDALDECTSETDLADLISLLGQALSNPDIPVIHILLTSRSEAHIHKAIQEEGVRPLVCEIPAKTSGEGVAKIISLDGADVDNDICIFLEQSFRKLRSRVSNFPQPTKDELARLASRAGRRFIVASTMMKFIDDGDNDPHDRLQLMLELTSELLPGTEVYKLYDRILSTCADPKRAYLHLSVVAALADPLPISQISKLLGPGEGRDVETALVQLRSVMDIPSDSSVPVNIYHSSIRDYVSDPSNCGLPEVQHLTSPHSLLAHSCLRLMNLDIPGQANTALLDALLALKGQSQAMESDDPGRLKYTLSFIVKRPEPLQVVTYLVWLRGRRGSGLQHWLGNLDGHSWLRTQPLKDWLQTQEAKDWLQTLDGQEWLQTWGGQEWLQTQGGQERLQTHGGQERLQTQGGREWLHTESGKDWLQSPGGQDWLQSPGGCDWLQGPSGRDWMQTPDGQAWQSTPAASLWVIMEDFLSTFEAMNECSISPELLLLPAFQVIQHFRSLPDFLMFPVFLALLHHGDPILASSHDLPDIDIIHAMTTFTIFADEAQERSRSASAALKYASQNFAVHLERAPKPWDDNLHHAFKSFWNHHLLSWLERQWCLKGLRSCLVILSAAQQLAKDALPEETAEEVATNENSAGDKPNSPGPNDRVLEMEIPGQEDDYTEYREDFVRGMSYSPEPRRGQRMGLLKRLLAVVKTHRSAPSPTPPMSSTSPPITLRARLQHILPRRPDHAAPLVVNVFPAEALERYVAAHPRNPNDNDVIPDEHYDPNSVNPREHESRRLCFCLCC